MFLCTLICGIVFILKACGYVELLLIKLLVSVLRSVGIREPMPSGQSHSVLRDRHNIPLGAGVVDFTDMGQFSCFRIRLPDIISQRGME